MKNVTLVFLAGLGFFGCEQAHPVQKSAILILDAIKFGDSETIVKYHIESTKQATFCTDEFKRALKKIEETKSKIRCTEIESISTDDFSTLSDEAKLTAKITRFSCSNSVKSCESFSSELLKERFDDSSWMTEVKSYKVVRALGDEENAVVYVEFAGLFGVRRNTLRFKNISSRWILKSGLDH